MYAAIVVCIWSEMEQFLKRLVNSRIEAMTAGNDPRQNKNFKGFRGKRLSSIHIICRFYREHLSIDLSSIADYPTVNAIRILNNFFKHKAGHYRFEPETEDYDKIDQLLFDKWHLFDSKRTGGEDGVFDYEIDYSQLPIQELVWACNTFCRELLDKLITQTAAT